MKAYRITMLILVLACLVAYGLGRWHAAKHDQGVLEFRVLDTSTGAVTVATGKQYFMGPSNIYEVIEKESKP